MEGCAICARSGIRMARTFRIATMVCVLLAAEASWAQHGPAQESSPQERADRIVENRSAHPAWITVRHPDLGPDASSSRCVAPGAAARFVDEPAMRTVLSAESRSGEHCRGATSCGASIEWPANQAVMSFSSSGKGCTLGARKLLGMRPTDKWGQLFVANESRTHALFVRVSPPPMARASEDEFACIRPGYSARFLVPPGEEENWKRGRYNRFIEGDLRPLGSNCTLRTVCRSSLEVEWIAPGDRKVQMRASDQGPRKIGCQLEMVR
jgi:hypothetical protein